TGDHVVEAGVDVLRVRALVDVELPGGVQDEDERAPVLEVLGPKGPTRDDAHDLVLVVDDVDELVPRIHRPRCGAGRPRSPSRRSRAAGARAHRASSRSVSGGRSRGGSPGPTASTPPDRCPGSRHGRGSPSATPPPRGRSGPRPTEAGAPASPSGAARAGS